MEELRSFSEDLSKKPMLVVASKLDAAQSPERVASLRRMARKRRLPFFKISSVTGEGIPELRRAMAEAVLLHAGVAEGSPPEAPAH
jgi:GTP-binding protein